MRQRSEQGVMLVVRVIRPQSSRTTRCPSGAVNSAAHTYPQADPRDAEMPELKAQLAVLMSGPV